MSARVYFMKRVKDCKYVSIMSPHDEQCRRTSLLCILQFSCFILSTTVCSQNINKQNVNIAEKLLQITAFSVGITILNQRIIWKDDIEFVTEFPCLLGHPVYCRLEELCTIIQCTVYIVSVQFTVYSVQFDFYLINKVILKYINIISWYNSIHGFRKI